MKQQKTIVRNSTVSDNRATAQKVVKAEKLDAGDEIHFDVRHEHWDKWRVDRAKKVYPLP